MAGETKSPNGKDSFLPLLFVTAVPPSPLPEKTETNKQNQTNHHDDKPLHRVKCPDLLLGSLNSVAEQMEFVWMGVGGIPTLHLGNGGEDVGSAW